MISVFDVFKIILGIIISVFIIFIVLRFVGSYMEIGESGRQVSLMVNFKKTVENVYTTGIATDFELKENEILGYRPPLIETAAAFIDTSPTPVLLQPGKKLSVSRIEYDAGWWKFYVIEALPENKIIFIPLRSDAETWALIGNITKALPSTENTDTKVKFGFGCTNRTVPRFGREGYKFTGEIIPMVLSLNMELGMCENAVYWQERNYTLVTVSGSEEDAAFVVAPVEGSPGVGHVYIKTDEGYRDYIYKSGIDVAALLLGGQIFYDYINEKFMSELDVAASVSAKEYNLLLGDPEISRRCGSQINEFISLLNQIRETINKMRAEESELAALEFSGYLRDSQAKFRQMESMGCT